MMRFASSTLNTPTLRAREAEVHPGCGGREGGMHAQTNTHCSCIHMSPPRRPLHAMLRQQLLEHVKRLLEREKRRHRHVERLQHNAAKSRRLIGREPRLNCRRWG